MNNDKLVRLSTIRDLFDGCDYNKPVGIPFLLSVIEQLPAVDAVEVRHGHWLRTPTAWVYCSVCGEEPPQETNARTRFCPNCGAKMDGGKHETD
jgi:hypothetical protein